MNDGINGVMVRHIGVTVIGNCYRAVFGAGKRVGNPNVVTFVGLSLVPPGIVSFYVVRNGRNVARAGHGFLDVLL